MTKQSKIHNRLHEFFEVKGVLAMRNLTVFITIITATIIVLFLAIKTNEDGETRLSSEIFISYMLAGGGVYSFGKWQDDKTRRSEIESTADPVPVTNTTINQPGNVNMPPSTGA